MTKCVCSRGSTPDPAGGAYSTPPEPLAGFKAPTAKGSERWRGKGWEGKWSYRYFFFPTLSPVLCLQTVIVLCSVGRGREVGAGHVIAVVVTAHVVVVDHGVTPARGALLAAARRPPSHRGVGRGHHNRDLVHHSVGLTHHSADLTHHSVGLTHRTRTAETTAVTMKTTVAGLGVRTADRPPPTDRLLFGCDQWEHITVWLWRVGTSYCFVLVFGCDEWEHLTVSCYCLAVTDGNTLLFHVTVWLWRVGTRYCFMLLFGCDEWEHVTVSCYCLAVTNVLLIAARIADLPPPTDRLLS